MTCKLHDFSSRAHTARSHGRLHRASQALIRSLDPDFDVVKASFPYFVRFKGWDTVKQVQDYGTDARDRAAARHSSKV